ncbi:sugar-binding domain-containing protein [Opitutus sp. ER46]|uniref:sugar-binding domain-containing protein n=1 Tax=Opitutus sp. ER46 TaxID=2161864 RepID=UPI0018EEB870|nr:sugar-binding domain-containing protein [Opitutus sp. ER46]
MSLAGAWRVALDRDRRGRDQRWPAAALPGDTTLTLPGSVQENRLGDPIGVDTPWTGGIFDRAYFTAPEYAPYRQSDNIKIPFWLQPATHFVGHVWYQREIDLPAAWVGRQVWLTLERPHWKTALWLDDEEIGTNSANSVPHRYALGLLRTSGRRRLTILVDNTLDPDVGENAHSVSDHTQGNWNGIVGRIELSATEAVWFDDVQVAPRLADRTVVVRGQLGRAENQPWPVRIQLASPGAPAVLDVPVAADGRFAAEYAFPAGAAAWDEFTPALHTLTVSMPNGESREVAFGFRQIATDGRQLRFNGRRLFLRGALDCAAFPRTGHPPTRVADWKRQLEVIKAHGLNHVRFHSWCPPEAAFVAADELGLYVQVEVASWPNWSTTLGDGKPVDAWLEAETARILRVYGNHPSFVILCACNEPEGPHHKAWLGAWVARHRAADPRRLYTAGAGWPEIPANDFHISPEPRIQHWLEGLASRLNARAPETRTDYTDYIQPRDRPVVAHEIGQWCAYPNFAERAKYTGYLQPRNFEIFQASLAAHGLADQADAFVAASGKLQTLCYKEDIESALRTPGMGGFQLLGLADFPGQGTALVGVLDAFWESKGYVTPAAYRRFCASTVPLARLDRRVFTTDEHLIADVEVAHFGAAPLPGVSAEWSLQADDGRTVAQGRFAPRDVAVGAGQRLGRIDLPCADLPAPARYRLEVRLPGTDFANDWEVWVYPRPADVAVAVPAGIEVVTQLDAATQARLAAGATVWLMLPPDRVAPDPVKGPIALGFSSIFWNTAWTNGQAPHTLGVLCDPAHPALAQFPTDAYSNWQWWYPLRHAAPMVLDSLPRDLRPTVQVIDDWFTNRKLALGFEARVGRGKLLVTSIALHDAALDPVRRQLRASLLAYLASPAFAPTVEVTPAQVQQVIKGDLTRSSAVAP